METVLFKAFPKSTDISTFKTTTTPPTSSTLTTTTTSSVSSKHNPSTTKRNYHDSTTEIKNLISTTEILIFEKNLTINDKNPLIPKSQISSTKTSLVDIIIIVVFISLIIIVTILLVYFFHVKPQRHTNHHSVKNVEEIELQSFNLSHSENIKEDVEINAIIIKDNKNDFVTIDLN
jgi:hypothetical protein